MTKTALGCAAILALAILLAPDIAAAGLLNDTVSATLTELDANTVIFSGSAVVGAGVEFTGSFGVETWSLDLSDTGFSLFVDCPDSFGSQCDHPSGAELVISGLDFTPPAALTGLLNPVGELAPGNPVISPTSVTITFGAFSLDSSLDPQEMYSAGFQTTPLPSVPLPATLALVAAGLGLAGLALRRPRG